MTRKDYVLIQSAIARAMPRAPNQPAVEYMALLNQHARIVLALADALAADGGPRFDRDRFITECYGKGGADK